MREHPFVEFVDNDTGATQDVNALSVVRVRRYNDVCFRLSFINGEFVTYRYDGEFSDYYTVSARIRDVWRQYNNKRESVSSE